jgi:Tol biopolymer transport system component/predicted Ser/Thr protein kinase
MTGDQWRTVWRIFHDANQVASEERSRFIESEASDPEIRQRVIELLRKPPDPDDFEPEIDDKDYTGTELGRYQVGGLLRRGGMGQVYSGLDRDLGRPVALKFLLPGAMGNPAALKRIADEAKAASAMNHPNIVTIYEVVEGMSMMAIAMEFVDGISLRDLAEGALPAAQIIDIGRQASSALAAAHEIGIVHRDIKPENLMLRPDGFVKVLDFGLARKLTAESHRSLTGGLPAGTLRYMSPEQLREDAVTSATDVYSLGIVLYELTTGRHPFESLSTFETAFAMHSREAPPASSIRRDVPAWLDRLISQMLRRDAAQRPTMKEVAAILAAGTPNAGPPFGRRRMLWGAAAVAAVGTAGAFIRLRKGATTESVRPEILQAGPLTGLDGVELSPAISPDGRQVLYTQAEDDGSSALYLKLIGGGPPIRLDQGTANVMDPAWSSDGLQVAFGRKTADHVALRIMPALGGPEREVAKVTYVAQAERILTWHPDQKALVAADRARDDHTGQALWRFPLDGLARLQLTSPPPNQTDQAPAFSPDGTKLAFLRRSGQNGHIHVMDGSGERRLTSENQVLDSVAWAADGQSLLFTVHRSTGRSLWRIPAGGGSSRQVGEIGLSPFNPSVAARGDRLVYTQIAEPRADLLRFSLSKRPTAMERIVSSTGMNVDPAYSPDGSRIAFSSNRSGNFEIWVAANDGSNAMALTSLGGNGAGSPRWSPDGTKIAFDHQFTVWIVSATGGQPRKLASGALPAWSVDGEWIYFVSTASGMWQIWRAPAAGGPAGQVTRGGGFECLATPDGKYLYYTKAPDRAGIWRLSLAGGEEAEQPALRAVAGHRYWNCSNWAIYFLDGSGGRTQVMRFDLATGAVTRTVAGLNPTHPLFRGIAVDPNEQSLLWVQRVRRVSQIILVEGFR